MKLILVTGLLLVCLLPFSYSDSARKDQARTCCPCDLCPPDFTLIQGHCYYFSQEVMNNWDEAQMTCHELDPRASLAGMETLKEWHILKTYLTEQKLTSKNWLLGGSDRESEGHWTWVGTNQPFSFSDWCPGEPSNSRGEEACLNIWIRDNRWCWNDRHCTKDTGYDLHFICEI